MSVGAHECTHTRTVQWLWMAAAGERGAAAAEPPTPPPVSGAPHAGGWQRGCETMAGCAEAALARLHRPASGDSSAHPGGPTDTVTAVGEGRP